MNNYYDYMVVRIYKWYETFDNEPSLFTAELLIALHQSFLVFIALGLTVNYKSVDSVLLKVIFVGISLIILLRLHIRYSNKEFFNSLLEKWKNEPRKTKLFKGIFIPIVILMPLVVFVIIFSPTRASS